MEHLSRGVVAVNQGNGKVFISWRMLATDPDDVAFNIYKTNGNAQPIKLNAKPITESTNYVDENAEASQRNSYTVKTVVKGKETETSKEFVIPENAPVQQYLSIPLQAPKGYTPNDASVGDLDGDGDYEIIIHQVGRGRDNSQAGFT
jgi:rhamnogalacturonan endolyase